MQFTTNYNLKKPELTDEFDPDTAIGDNLKIIDQEIWTMGKKALARDEIWYAYLEGDAYLSLSSTFANNPGLWQYTNYYYLKPETYYIFRSLISVNCTSPVPGLKMKVITDDMDFSLSVVGKGTSDTLNTAGRVDVASLKSSGLYTGGASDEFHFAVDGIENIYIEGILKTRPESEWTDGPWIPILQFAQIAPNGVDYTNLRDHSFTSVEELYI